MTDFNYIENYIINFIDRHVSERVAVSVKQKCISIHPVKKKGSILLAMFWIKVLQSKHNYPANTVSYNKKKLSDSELIFLFIDDVMVSVNLLTGTFTIEGSLVLKWFRHKMLDIIWNFTGYRDTRSAYKDDTTKSNQSNAAFNDKVMGHLVVKESQQHNSILEDEHLSNLMVESVLEAACESIRQSSLKMSRSWIYRLWKSLLYKWMCNANIKVIIATSKIDSQRLQDIADISLLLRATSQIETIYLPFHFDGDTAQTNLATVKRQMLSAYNAKEQLWIEYEINNRIIVPNNGVGCNFIAGILPDNRVQLMLTSCRFNGSDFGRDCLHSVQFLEMSEYQFDRLYISNFHSKELSSMDV